MISSSLSAGAFVRRLQRAAMSSGAPAGPTLAIRREDASIWERRAPLAPHHVQRLTRQGVRVLVQPSNRRAYPMRAYLAAGAEAREDISQAPVVLGVKQVPVEALLPNRTYCFFSHTIKAQPDNMALLDHVLANNIRLIDYERLVDERDQRVVAFGKFAGYAGMIDILHGLGLRLLALGHHTPFMHIGPAHNYRNVGAAKQAIRDAGYEIALGKMPESIGPLTFVFTGSGNVSQGAREVFGELPVEYVQPQQLSEVAQNGDTSRLYGTVVSRADHLRPKAAQGGLPVDLEQYGRQPGLFESSFASDIAPFASVIVNGVYWAPGSPRLLSSDDALRLQSPPPPSSTQAASVGSPALPHRLVAICDISADPGGSIEFMRHCTTIDNPFCLYDARSGATSAESFAGDGILICSIDNMPTQLPLESTDMFGELLYPHLPDIVRSEASRAVEAHSFGPVVKAAIIASNGALRPQYEYIQELRRKRDAQPAGSGAKRVLVLGAGHVSGPLIEYLCRDPAVEVVLVSARAEELAERAKLAQGWPGKLRTRQLDAGQPRAPEMAALIRDSQLVVSLLPYELHPVVAEACIEAGTNMLTASYLSPDMRKLDGRARAANVTVLNEMGLDPGLDHLLAMEAIEEARATGARVTGLESYCCGLPTPESADNPLGYKFGWNPAGAFAITLNAARWRQDGRLLEAAPGGALMEQARPVEEFLRGFALEVFPNRDSLAYESLYGLEGAQTIKRGTLRYRGFSETILALRQVGLMEQQPVAGLEATSSWPQLLGRLLGLEGPQSECELRRALLARLQGDQQRLAGLERLGLLAAGALGPGRSPFEWLRAHLIRRYPFEAADNDLVVMRVGLQLELAAGGQERRARSLVVYGEPGGFSAMAKTVGYPAAIAARLLLEGQVREPGMLLPLSASIYKPVLAGLRREGIWAR